MILTPVSCPRHTGIHANVDTSVHLGWWPLCVDVAWHRGACAPASGAAWWTLDPAATLQTPLPHSTRSTRRAARRPSAASSSARLPLCTRKHRVCGGPRMRPAPTSFVTIGPGAGVGAHRQLRAQKLRWLDMSGCHHHKLPACDSKRRLHAQLALPLLGSTPSGCGPWFFPGLQTLVMGCSTGWITHWGEAMANTSAADIAEGLRTVLEVRLQPFGRHASFEHAHNLTEGAKQRLVDE